MLLLLSSCTANHNNEKMRQKIDALPFTKTILEIKVDSNDNHLDTISITKYKYDQSEKLKAEHTTYNSKEYESNWLSYFDEKEDLFYKEGDLGNDFKSIFWTEKNSNGIVTKSFQLEWNEKNEFDTIIMNHTDIIPLEDGYTKSIIKSKHARFKEIKGIHERIFDDEEKLVKVYMILNKDTTRLDELFYENTKLVQTISKINSNKDTSKLILNYNADEKIINEKTIKYNQGEEYITSYLENIYNESGEKVKSIREDYENENKVFVKYIIIPTNEK